MDLHRFRRHPSGTEPRLSIPATSHAAPLPVAGRERHSTGSAAHDAVYSPRAFHRLSTPSRLPPSAASPTSRLSRLSAHSSNRPSHDGAISEGDEAASVQQYTAGSRRFSSSPSTAKTPPHSQRPTRRESRRRSSIPFSVASGRRSSKWDPPRPWYHSLSMGTWPRKSRLRRLLFWCGAVGLLLFCFSLVFILPADLQRLAPIVIGALLSFISALTILVSFLLQPQNRRYPNELLVYVAMCEFSLAVLALSRILASCSDASYTCRALGFTACSITTGLELFLLLASVGWFGCAILHLFVSVSNPFANYKSQLIKYHATVWGGSLLVSLVVPLLLFSERTQSRYNLTGVEICRAVGLTFPLLPAFTSDDDRDARIAQWQTLNMEFWGTLFALVVLLVIAAQLILAVGWWRSNSGTVIALKARRRMMKRMTTYVHTLNVTWLLLLVVFFTYRANPGALHHLAAISTVSTQPTSSTASSSSVGMNALDALFHFILAAKGYFTCVVWLAVNRHCCAIRRPMLCKDPFSSRGSLTVEGYHSSDDDESESDSETNAFSLTHLTASRGLATSASRPSVSLANASSSLSASFASQNNETLQREIIYYTVCGITKAIRKSSQLNAANSDVYYQQLLVGADHESTLLPVPLPSQGGGGGGSEPMTMTMLGPDRSPRAYCLTGGIQSLSLTSTANVDTSIGSSSQSFTAAALQGSRDDSVVLDPHASSQSFSSATSVSRVPQQRFSMYPVSHVPFELFEQEIELQSHRSSEAASLSLSPLFANLRRTAHALYSSNTSSGAPKGDPVASTATAAESAASRDRNGSRVEHPRPKMFIDYAPTEFRAIRTAFGLSDESYLASFRSTAKERVSAGSSGAFMFFSGDNALIVKSMKEKECKTLVARMPQYADYVTSNPASRIIRFFGCHRIRLYGRNFYFVVMANVLHSPLHTPTITEKYDIKGSWVDRQARLPQHGELVTCSECNATYVYGRGDAATTYPFHVHRPDTVLKDLDLTRPLMLGRRVARELYEQLERDCEFLNSMGIMDYSLLVGVHKCSHPDDGHRPWRRDFMTSLSFLQASANGPAGSASSSDGSSGGACGIHLEPLPEDADCPEEVYFIGIIDILQEWSWEKQLEKVGKTLIGKSSSGISAVAPDAYCQRFKSRVAQVLRLVVDEACEDERETKRLVKQPSLHPSISGSCDSQHLEFEISESHSHGLPQHDEEDEEDEHEAVGVVWDSALDETLQFEAEAIAVASDLENGRVSLRL